MFTLRICMPCPGTLAPKRRRMPSSGWMRIASMFGSIWGTPRALKSASGARLNWIAISVTRLGQRLAGAQVERHAGPAPGVDLELAARRRSRSRSRARPPARRGTTGSARPRPSRRRTGRARRSSATSLGAIGLTARSTLSFSSRRSSASNSTGGSIANMASSCSRWFCTMSRSAPVCVVELAATLDADRLGHGDLDASRCSAGSRSARRGRCRSGRPRRFWTVSLPR